MQRSLVALLGFSTFALYLYGAYPSVSIGDAGEFITAAFTLGIPHAPGFPLYSLLGHLFIQGVPLGNPAYRMNIFSALAASGAVVLFFLTMRQMMVRTSIAFVCALLWGCSSALMANARASEVFALNALLTVAVLYAASARLWVAAFFLVGLGSANHQILAFLLPALIVAFFLDEKVAGALKEQLLWSVLFFICGLLLYGVLFLRAAQQPFLNIGHADSFERLWRVISRADYGSLTLALGDVPARTAANTFLQIRRWLLGMVQQGTPWMVLVAGYAVVRLPRIRASFWLACLAFVMLGPVFFVMGNLPFDAQSTGLLVRFLIAPAVCLLLLAALGLEALATKSRWIAPLLLVLALGWQGLHADGRGYRDDFTAYAYGLNNLRSLPPHAHFIMDGGDDTFYIMAYLTHVESRRQDVTFNDRGGVVFAHPYGQDFRRLNHDDKEARRQEIERTLAASDTPLYYSTMNTERLAGFTLVPRGLLYKAQKGATDLGEDLWPLYDLRGVAPWDEAVRGLKEDYRTRALLPFYAYQRALEEQRQGHTDTAWLWMRSAAQMGPDVLWLVPNIIHSVHLWAFDVFNQKRYSLARDLYRWILELNPQDDAAQRNLPIVQKQMLP